MVQYPAALSWSYFLWAIKLIGAERQKKWIKNGSDIKSWVRFLGMTIFFFFNLRT